MRNIVGYDHNRTLIEFPCLIVRIIWIKKTKMIVPDLDIGLELLFVRIIMIPIVHQLRSEAVPAFKRSFCGMILRITILTE